MNIQPLADRVLIKPAPAEEKTVGGIIIPDTAKLPEKARKTKKWYSKPATKCFMANMPVRKWNLTVRNISSCVRATCWPFSDKLRGSVQPFLTFPTAPSKKSAVEATIFQ